MMAGGDTMQMVQLKDEQDKKNTGYNTKIL